MANESKQQKQADWAQTDSTAVDYIKNKPEIPDEQVQADWNQSKISAKDYIKNKPYISGGLPTVSEDNNGQVLRVVNGSWGLAQLSLLSKSITANGSYTASDENSDGYSAVTVNVPNTYTSSDEGKVVSNGGLVSQTSKNVASNGTVDTTLNNQVVVEVAPNVGSKTITENGTYNASSDNYDGYSQIIVEVAGGGAAEPVLTIKTVYENGTYTASNDGADGYSQVNADVHVGIIEPYVYDLAGYGYVNNGTWNVAGGSISCTDIYEVESGNMYLILLGSTVGSRFRAMFSTTDTSTASSDISGTSIINQNNPQQYAYSVYKPTSDGYLTITKDNAGVTGLKTFVFSVSDLIDGNSVIDHSGDGSQVVLKILTATANGTYSASSDNADGYSSVTVNVPNSYTSSDEGKVVSSGTLVSQTSKNVTSNGTVDTTLNNQVVVDVTPNVGSKTVTENGTYNASSDNYDGYSQIVVNVDGGGGVAPVNDVNFRDYDGTIVASYSASDFASLSALPSNPSHTGLTAQGWNWTLANAKAYVAKYGRLEIGQMYITDDGKTRVYIHLEQGRTSPMLGVCPNGTVDVDWGDGTEHDTLTGTSVTNVQWTQTHNYAAPGDYVIQLTVAGSMGFYGSSTSDQYSGFLRYASGADGRNRVYQNAIQRVEIGRGVTRIGSYAFYNCYSLVSINIPDSVTSIFSNAFQNCFSLASINIPDSVTSIRSNAFYNCYSLASISIPDSVTSIGTYVFMDCYSLTSINIPDGVTSIGGYVFYYCYSLASISIPDSVTSIGSYAFYYCYSLASISIPGSITSIGSYAFQNCFSLASINIPDGVTSIGSNAFQNCFSLASINIPDSVTSIRSNAFYKCYGMSEYHFASTTPPTVDNANAFTDIAADCIIYVPTGSLAAYQSAANYPDPNTYTYIEE